MDWRQMKEVVATSWSGLGATVLAFEWMAGEWKLRGRLMAKSGEKQVIVPMCIVGAGNNRHCVIAVPGPGREWTTNTRRHGPTWPRRRNGGEEQAQKAAHRTPQQEAQQSQHERKGHRRVKCPGWKLPQRSRTYRRQRWNAWNERRNLTRRRKKRSKHR